MIIQHNLLAMNANRMYWGNDRRQVKSSERLSSGYRINRAADDAAGLAISEKMRRQIRGLTQASLNAQDGISMVQIADGAMAEVHEMLHRGTELSIKAANGTLTDDERSYIQREITQIKDEIDAISDKTTFNEILVLKGKDVPVPEGNVEVIIAGGLPDWVTRKSQKLSSGSMDEEYETTQTYESPILDSNGTAVTNPDGTPAVKTTQVTIPHEAAILDFSNFTGSDQQLKDLENNGFYTTCCTCSNHYSIKFTLDNTSSMERSGSHYIYNIGIAGVKDAKELLDRIVQGTNNGNPQRHFTKLVADAANKKLIIYDDRSNAADPNASAGNTSRYNWPDWDNPQFNVTAGGNYGKFGPGTAYAKEDANKLAKVDWVVLQVGAEKGHELAIELPSISTGTLGIQGVDVSTQNKASRAISDFKGALKYVSEERSRMGAYQNRLEHTIANLDNVVENTQAAESAIRDTDMAKLLVEHANSSVLAQAGVAMMTQANMNNQGVLALLR